MPETLGYKTKGVSSWDIGKFFACRHVCPKNGILNSISVYLFNDSGSTQKIQLGIYNDVSGTPGKRLISTISISIPAAFNAWRTIVLTAFLNLGSAYWLTLQLENSAAIVYVYYDAGDEEQQAYKEDWDFGTWPDNPVGLSYYPNKLSIYATYTLVPVSPYNWGLLSKNQIDPERIESAISRITAEHNDDEQAHIGEGRSLDQHKLSDVIDHVVKSIIADKIKDGEVSLIKFTHNHKFIFTTFESLDGWVKGGVGTEIITCVIGGTKLETGSVNNDTAFIAAVPVNGFGDNPNFDKKPIAQALIKIMDKVYAEVHFHVGQFGFQSAGNDYIGFFFDQSKVYAVCRRAAASETKSEIIDAPEPENPHIYRIVYVNGDMVEFYIDGFLKMVITTNIPWGDNEEACIFLGVKNSHNGGEQTIGVYHTLYQEEP